ncbi:hypothetical protein [Lentzea guizhouensis]|nr:hypothetical protein [Lentzea guizhouensis]
MRTARSLLPAGAPVVQVCTGTPEGGRFPVTAAFLPGRHQVRAS